MIGVSVRKFDLNIERILEDWDVCHAIREIIANAIDEQRLTNTKDIEIFQDSKSRWHIRDYGRGLKYTHLTQKENEEKLSNPHIIGKFGIGLKDALATFDRKGVKVIIKSKHGEITLGRSKKHDFEDIITLHAYISSPPDRDFIGTEVILERVTKRDIAMAKDFFLRFSGEKVLEKTKYGEILEKKRNTARIYVNGVKVAEEENFLFSYNITSLTSAIRKAMNRERTNVGRSAYSGRVKSMLLNCRTSEVASRLVNDLRNFQTGKLHDELNWIDVQEHAIKTLSAQSRVIFLTPDQLIQAGNMVDEALQSRLEIVTISERLHERIQGQVDISGKPIRDLGRFITEYNESFEFKFVKIKDLTATERRIFDKTDAIFQLIDGKPNRIHEVLISETMRKDTDTFVDRVGLWDSEKNRIIVKRSVLQTLEDYAGTLLHETGHAISNASDCSRDFESELTRIIGLIVAKVLTSKSGSS